MRRLRRILLWTILILCLPIVLIAGGAAAFIRLSTTNRSGSFSVISTQTYFTIRVVKFKFIRK